MTGRRIATLVVASLVHVFAAAQAGKPVVQAEVSRLADTAHLEFRGLKNWRYDLQKDGAKISLTIPALDNVSIAKLRGFNDPLIKAVSVDKGGPDGNYVVQFQLAHPEVETFDYLTDEPSRLIVDFYRKPADAKPATAAAADSDKKVVPKKKAKGTSTAANRDDYKTSDKAGRSPAGDEFLSIEQPRAAKGDLAVKFGVFDGGDEDYDRFRIKDYEIREDAIIASRQNIYLPFPMLKMRVSQLDKLMEEVPEYKINPKDSKENKEARLLLTLFERRRHAVFIKTYDYFTEKYPNSEYAEILKNVAGHVYLRRWRESVRDLTAKAERSTDFEQARKIYSELIQKFTASPLREYNYLTLGFAQMERGEALSTLQTFQDFLKTYPNSPEVAQVRKALAESYLVLHKYDEATEQYHAIIKDFAKTLHASESKYRLGDVQFAKGDFSAAIQAYEKAIKEVPQFEKTFPNANFNMAESRFWQKDHKKALSNYVEFLNNFPSHGHGGYALTRVGELLGILGADQRRVMGAFLESYFRFPDHPGSKVARIRMLSQQMRGMKEKELKKALEEIVSYAETLDIKDIKQFATLMTAEGLTSRGENKEALSHLISYYQKNPAQVNSEVFKGRILRNIANEMKSEVERGNFLKALAFHSQYAGTWLKNSDRIDVPFYLGGAFERAGAFNEAQKIFTGALNRRKAIVGTNEEKEKKVQEHLPSVASLNLRLAATMTEERKYLEAYQLLKTIGAGVDLNDQETIERVQLSAQIAEQRNEPVKAREALQELATRWQGDPALVAPVNLQLSQAYMKMGDPKQAEFYAEKVLEADAAQSQDSEHKIADKVVADALNVKGDALFQQKKALSAVDSYQKLLERFEAKMPLASVRYHVGQILFDRGDLNGAADVWKRLEGTPNEFLYKVGKEKIEDGKWKSDYDKYMNRIPAMSGQAPASGRSGKETK